MPLMAFAGVVVLVSGCAQEPAGAATGTPEPAGIIVEPAELRLAAGSAGELAAQVNDAAGQPIGGAEIRFSAVDDRVLEVSRRGTVTSLGPAARTAIVVASGRSTQRVPVEVVAGPPQRIEKLGGDGQTVHAGMAPGEPLAVRVLDFAGNPLGGFALVLEAEDGAALAGEAVTGQDGRATIELPSFAAAGSRRLRVRGRDSGTPSETTQLDVRPGAPAVVEVSCAQRESGPQGEQRLALGLHVRDAHGNPAADAALQAILDAKEPAAEFRTDAAGFARLQLPLASSKRAPVLEVLAGETRVARVTLAPTTEGCAGNAPAPPAS